MIDNLTTGCRIYLCLVGIGTGSRVCDRVAVPDDRVAYMQDAGLDRMALFRFGDLEVDDTVALVRAVVLVHCVAEDKAYRIQNRVEITLAVNDCVFVLADCDTLHTFRRGINREVDTIDTVCVMNRLEYILILLGLTDRVLQILAAP